MKPTYYNASGAETFYADLSQAHGEDTDENNVTEEDFAELGYTPIKAWRKGNLVVFETGQTDDFGNSKVLDVGGF